MPMVMYDCPDCGLSAPGNYCRACFGPPEVCKHTSVMPGFDEDEAHDMSATDVRKRWPRFMGKCPSCEELVILYASTRHYLHGDW